VAGGFQLTAQRLRWERHGGPYALRLEPSQPVFRARQVQSGVTRPEDGAHLWRSDPGAPGPAWLLLTWNASVTVRTVELTFPGHLMHEVHAEPPFHRDPETARDYALEIPDGDGWREVLQVSENYQRRRVHELPAAISITQLRLRLDATWGDPAKGLFEIRCYG